MAVYIGLRMVTLIYQSLVNDLYFTYHQMMLAIFLILIAVDVFLYLVVISNYQELSDMTRLEDMAKLKMVGVVPGIHLVHNEFKFKKLKKRF